jgi:IMP cyclohydrolase
VKFLELGGLTPLNGVAAGEAFVEVVAADGVRVAVRLKDSSPALLAVIGALRGQS